MNDKAREKQAEVAESAATDPVQQVGTHPLGTVTGALGGAAAGAVMGIAAGPVGSLAGAIGGAIAGAALGSGGVGATPVTGPAVEPTQPVEANTTESERKT
jgi:phage tail tape-measure protein